MVSEFTITSTSNGPVVLHNGKLITLRDSQELIDLAEENSNFINAMNEHIIDSLGKCINEYIYAFTLRYDIPKAQILAYIDAADQFLSWENIVWFNYRQALHETLSRQNPELRLQ